MDRIRFSAELAGIPFEVQCRFEENRSFFQDYLTDRKPMFSCRPEEEDLDMVRQRLIRQLVLDGKPPAELSDRILENNAIHMLVAKHLIRYQILVMHGSAISVNGNAYLFTARSGTGKSTHTRLWRDTFGDRACMINDDKPLLRFGVESQVCVCGSPWSGKHRLGCNRSAPLKAVAALFRAKENSCIPMDRVQAFPVIRRSVYAPFEAAAARQALMLENSLLERVPFYRLECNMEPEAARIAWEAMHS